jgi:outer membrane protein TolC
VQAARLAAEQTAKNLGLTRCTRFVSVLELGLVRNTSNEARRQTGWEVGLELPLFDWGGARTAQGRGHLHAVPAPSRRDRHQCALRSARGLRQLPRSLRHRPPSPRRDRAAAKRISDEQLLRYNGMLIGVFELLADARSQIASVNASIEALRDFWLAKPISTWP